jgi:hypothetical protein
MGCWINWKGKERSGHFLTDNGSGHRGCDVVLMDIAVWVQLGTVMMVVLMMIMAVVMVMIFVLIVMVVLMVILDMAVDLLMVIMVVVIAAITAVVIGHSNATYDDQEGDGHDGCGHGG